jgi:hypothetical protein
MSGLAAIAGPAIYLSTLAFAIRHAQEVPPGLPIFIAAALIASALALAVNKAHAAPRPAPGAPAQA